MRQPAGRNKVERFIEAVGQRATSPGAVYLVGGACAVWLAWRESTIGIDLALAPEPGGLFGILERLKQELDVNIELTAPDQFVSPLPGWQGRSVFIQRVGCVDFYHYDFYSQAFAKLSRGHARDLHDVAAMVMQKFVEPRRLLTLVQEVVPELPRYPNLDSPTLVARIAAWAHDAAP